MKSDISHGRRNIPPSLVCLVLWHQPSLVSHVLWDSVFCLEYKMSINTSRISLSDDVDIVVRIIPIDIISVLSLWKPRRPEVVNRTVQVPASDKQVSLCITTDSFDIIRIR